MSPERKLKVSKYLSKHLRHSPEALGLQLAPGGWVTVAALLEACAKHRFPITREELDEVVATSDKKRFSFDDSGQQIRANQGHSTEVDLQLSPMEPPDSLFHGTAERHLSAIQKEGLLKMNRHHVHLSKDQETARRVGARHGKPVVLTVDAARMRQAGQLFYQSENGVWLVDTVPPEYLSTP